MRSKAQILQEASDNAAKTPDWDTTASLHERLTIEVLIDTRDQLTTIKIAALALNKHLESLS